MHFAIDPCGYRMEGTVVLQMAITCLILTIIMYKTPVIG